jgi:hypothetical protein
LRFAIHSVLIAAASIEPIKQFIISFIVELIEFQQQSELEFKFQQFFGQCRSPASDTGTTDAESWLSGRDHGCRAALSGWRQ